MTLKILIDIIGASFDSFKYYRYIKRMNFQIYVDRFSQVIFHLYQKMYFINLNY